MFRRTPLPCDRTSTRFSQIDDRRIYRVRIPARTGVSISRAPQSASFFFFFFFGIPTSSTTSQKHLQEWPWLNHVLSLHFSHTNHGEKSYLPLKKKNDSFKLVSCSICLQLSFFEKNPPEVSSLDQTGVEETVLSGDSASLEEHRKILICA